MGRFKRWLIRQYLPAWAKATLLQQNTQLKQQLEQLKKENECLRAYADGLKQGLYKARQFKCIEKWCKYTNSSVFEQTESKD